MIELENKLKRVYYLVSLYDQNKHRLNDKLHIRKWKISAHRGILYKHSIDDTCSLNHWLRLASSIQDQFMLKILEEFYED
jgi:hypothetical protein